MRRPLRKKYVCRRAIFPNTWRKSKLTATLTPLILPPSLKAGARSMSVHSRRWFLWVWYTRVVFQYVFRPLIACSTIPLVTPRFSTMLKSRPHTELTSFSQNTMGSIFVTYHDFFHQRSMWWTSICPLKQPCKKSNLHLRSTCNVELG